MKRPKANTVPPIDPDKYDLTFKFDQVSLVKVNGEFLKRNFSTLHCLNCGRQLIPRYTWDRYHQRYTLIGNRAFNRKRFCGRSCSTEGRYNGKANRANKERRIQVKLNPIEAIEHRFLYGNPV